MGLQECCSFFDGDNCTSDCGKDKFAGEETDFICVCTNRSLAHPDCKGKRVRYMSRVHKCTCSSNSGPGKPTIINSSGCDPQWPDSILYFSW